MEKLKSIRFGDIELCPYEFFVDGKRELSLDSPGKTEIIYAGKTYPAKQLPYIETFCYARDVLGIELK